MSLINDALKRAREAQSPPATSRASHLHFRPVEQNQVARHGFGVMLPVAFALVALLILFLVWELAQQNAATKQQSSHRHSELIARAASMPTTPPPAPAPAPEPPAPEPTAPPPTSASEAPAAPSPADPVPAAPAVADSSVPDELPAAPKPPPLRLQSVIFNPAHPSAMINGKIVFVGDKLGEFRVSDITKTTATIFNSSQTNILELAE